MATQQSSPRTQRSPPQQSSQRPSLKRSPSYDSDRENQPEQYIFEGTYHPPKKSRKEFLYFEDSVQSLQTEKSQGLIERENNTITNPGGRNMRETLARLEKEFQDHKKYTAALREDVSTLQKTTEAQQKTIEALQRDKSNDQQSRFYIRRRVMETELRVHPEYNQRYDHAMIRAGDRYVHGGSCVDDYDMITGEGEGERWGPVFLRIYGIPVTDFPPIREHSRLVVLLNTRASLLLMTMETPTERIRPVPEDAFQQDLDNFVLTFRNHGDQLPPDSDTTLRTLLHAAYRVWPRRP